jgi:RNA polymerase sigma factor (sigma-70 family)
VEVSALTHARTAPGLLGPSALLRLQSDERLIALTRRGQHAAFEVLCARYQTRLLSFVRHMLGCREDAEDVLQEVFAAAFNAVLADEREINVRPWLYRIARNRSLNHLRRATAVGVDSMDVHYAEHGLSTGDRVLRRESFRELLADVQQLPETQRTALLLREIDALSYDQIAHAMDTTVPSVKSLLVRARISLAEAAEARKLSCEEVRLELGEAAEGLLKVSPPARRHVRDCDRCRSFKRQLKDNNHALAAIFPVGPVLLLKNLLLAKLSSTASASSAHVASGAGATVGASAAAGAGAAGSVGAGGVFTIGAGALTTKAVAGLAAAAIVSAGAVAANQPAHHRHARAVKTAHEPAERSSVEPVVVSEIAQPISRAASAPSYRHAARHLLPAAKLRPTAAKAPTAAALAPSAAAPATASTPTTAATLPANSPGAKPGQPPSAPVTQLTSESTQLPAAATAPAAAQSAQPSAPAQVSQQSAASTAPVAAPPPRTTDAPTAAGGAPIAAAAPRKLGAKGGAGHVRRHVPAARHTLVRHSATHTARKPAARKHVPSSAPEAASAKGASRS